MVYRGVPSGADVLPLHQVSLRVERLLGDIKGEAMIVSSRRANFVLLDRRGCLCIWKEFLLLC